MERTIIFILNSSVAWQALHHVSSYAKWVSVQKFWKLFGFRFKSHEKDDKGKKVEFSCLSFIVVYATLLFAMVSLQTYFRILYGSGIIIWLDNSIFYKTPISVMWWILKLSFANESVSIGKKILVIMLKLHQMGFVLCSSVGCWSWLT